MLMNGPKTKEFVNTGTVRRLIKVPKKKLFNYVIHDFSTDYTGLST